jgi:serine/threonine-protein kinase
MADQRFQSGDQVGRYTLEKKIGSGGMGEVWKALSPDGVAVAIKFPHPELENQAYFKDFVREEAATNLIHPNIVAVEEILDVGGLPAIVFCFVEGGNLELEIYSDPKSLEIGRPLEVSRALAISRDVLDALDFAHRKGLVHRDVKANNILIEKSTGKALLSDFGLVMDVSVRKKTRYGMMGGSVPYMSPEQIRDNRAVDLRSDIYSFGIVLYEMLTGLLPFRVEPGESEDPDYLIKHKHRFSIAVPPGTLNPKVSRVLDQVVAKALEKEKDLRFRSCQEFAAALSALSSDAPAKRVVMPDFPPPADSWQAQSAGESLRSPVRMGPLRLSASQLTSWLPWLLMGFSALIIAMSLYVYFR